MKSRNSSEDIYENELFRSDFKTPHQNAVVGAGCYGFEYPMGFKLATLFLLSAAKDGSSITIQDSDEAICYNASVDALVYPICYNARHFIELFLKDSIRGVSQLRASSIKPPSTHNLGVLWNDFAEAIKTDDRLCKRGMPLEMIIKDVSSIDPDGTSFRYAHDLNGGTHLSGLSHINLNVLGDRLNKMFKEAEEFSVILEALLREYEQKTFTKKLHRENIRDIAKQLPPHDSWKNGTLDQVETSMCSKYKLSRREFGEIVNLIKSHREFSNLIGLEVPLNGIEPDVFERLLQIHNGTLQHDAISKTEWLSLEAILEIGRSDAYSEEYDPYLAEISKNNYEGQFLPECIVRNAFSPNKRLLKGLTKLGQKTLIKSLESAIPNLATPIMLQNK